MKNFVSNSTESTRMFKSGFLESLSKVHYTVPLIVFIPTILFFGWKGFQTPGITGVRIYSEYHWWIVVLDTN